MASPRGRIAAKESTVTVKSSA
jgi:hypothetical protein